MNPSPSIRFIRPDDARAVLDIYRPYIENTSITFETDVPSLADFQNRISAVTRQFPWLVYWEGDDVLGYAYANFHRKRAAYGWNAELSVYVSQDRRGGGIGSSLYKCLIALLKEQGYYNLYACITLPNDGSETFHKHFGFRRTGVFTHAGFKQGSWHDVIWMAKKMHDYDNQPKMPVSIESVPSDKVQKILGQNQPVL